MSGEVAGLLAMSYWLGVPRVQGRAATAAQDQGRGWLIFEQSRGLVVVTGQAGAKRLNRMRQKLAEGGCEFAPGASQGFWNQAQSLPLAEEVWDKTDGFSSWCSQRAQQPEGGFTTVVACSTVLWC